MITGPQENGVACSGHERIGVATPRVFVPEDFTDRNGAHWTGIQRTEAASIGVDRQYQLPFAGVSFQRIGTHRMRSQRSAVLRTGLDRNGNTLPETGEDFWLGSGKPRMGPAVLGWARNRVVRTGYIQPRSETTRVDFGKDGNGMSSRGTDRSGNVTRSSGREVFGHGTQRNAVARRGSAPTRPGFGVKISARSASQSSGIAGLRSEWQEPEARGMERRAVDWQTQPSKEGQISRNGEQRTGWERLGVATSTGENPVSFHRGQRQGQDRRAVDRSGEANHRSEGRKISRRGRNNKGWAGRASNRTGNDKAA